MIVLSLAACGGSPTSPEGPEGTYYLQTIDGQPVPYLIPHDFPSADERIRAGSRLEFDGVLRIIWLREWLDEAGVPIPGSQMEWERHALFIIDGNTIRLLYGDLSAMGSGTWSRDTITLVFPYTTWPGPELVFVFKK